jgi:hypothetical protein
MEPQINHFFNGVFMIKFVSMLSVLFIFTFFTISAQDFTVSPKPGEGGAPGGAEVEIEVHYDGPNTSAVGAANSTFIIATRLTGNMFTTYWGMGMTKVRFYIRDAVLNNSAIVRVYGPGTATTPGPILRQQTVTVTSMAWNTVTLTDWVLITATDVWIGIEATALGTGSQFWGGTDAGPRDPNGQFIYFNNAWTTLVALNPDLNFNWNIRGVVDTNVPVELESFGAQVDLGKVHLNWITATELNNYGFEIQKLSGDQFNTIGFVAGNGTSTEKHSYTFTDENVSTGVYSYRLKQIDYNGNFEYSDAIEVDVTPADFTLEQNYPNPFNPSTKIKFSLAAESVVSLKVFNVIGEEVAVLVNGTLPAGIQELDFNSNNLSSGIYFYKLEANGINGSSFSSVKKMILNK